MKLRFQADADIHPAVRKGVIRREPRIDFQAASGILPDGMRDSEVLALCAQNNRILVTCDVNTMPVHFRQFLERGSSSPGLILVPSARPIGSVIESLVLLWEVTTKQDLQDRIVWLP